MKFVFAIGFAALVGAGYYFADQYWSVHTPEAEHAAWKRTAVETETAVRPDSYAAMKWSPDDPKPEVRAPASEEAPKPDKAAKRKKH